MRKKFLVVMRNVLVMALLLSFGAQAAEYDVTVAQVQRKLHNLGYHPGDIDGVLGKQTVVALQQFQQRLGLAATGKLDAKTKEKLGVRRASFSKAQLRNTPALMSAEDIVLMIRERGFNHPEDYAEIGLSPTNIGNFPHNYELKSLKGQSVVIDHVTGLMWQQSAEAFVPGEILPTHISKMNANHYAGFTDWRLPTIEELASLMEGPEKKLDFIDDIFEIPLYYCVSADRVVGQTASAWVVSFEDGYIIDRDLNDTVFMLLVRSTR